MVSYMNHITAAKPVKNGALQLKGAWTKFEASSCFAAIQSRCDGITIIDVFAADLVDRMHTSQLDESIIDVFTANLAANVHDV